MTGQGNISEVRFSDQLSQREWSLIELYLNNMMVRGGSFHYDEIARKAVRFANVVIDTIDGIPVEWEDMHAKTEEEAAERERMDAEIEAELKRQSQTPPMERYRQGLPVRYEDIDREAKKAIFEQFLTMVKSEAWHNGIEKTRKRMASNNAVWIDNVRVRFADWLSFQERFEHIIEELPLIEKTEYGVEVEYFALPKEDRESLHHKFMTETRRGYAKGSDKAIIKYFYVLIPKNIWDEWKEEYQNKKTKNK